MVIAHDLSILSALGNSCKKCKGSKITKQKTKLELFIEPGSLDGERIVLTGEGDELVSCSTSSVMAFRDRVLNNTLPMSSYTAEYPTGRCDITTASTLASRIPHRTIWVPRPLLYRKHHIIRESVGIPAHTILSP